MHHLPRVWPRHPPRTPIIRRNFAIQRHRILERSKRHLAHHATDKPLGHRLTPRPQHTHVHLNARLPQLLHSLPTCPRVRVHHPNHHSPHLRLNQRIRARRRPPKVVARLQAHVSRCALCLGAGGPQRVDFSVRLAGARMKPLADDLVSRWVDEHAADGWVGAGLPGSAAGEFKAPRHVALVQRGSGGRYCSAAEGAATLRRAAKGRAI
mmetsp:Transcript_5236/g.12775  ORF Transcript_5236/g.12775 Transcript_5236/m.12775 type:complete len:209 (-) Transcript_5236:556-1182(-)